MPENGARHRKRHYGPETTTTQNKKTRRMDRGGWMGKVGAEVEVEVEVVVIMSSVAVCEKDSKMWLEQG